MEEQLVELAAGSIIEVEVAKATDKLVVEGNSEQAADKQHHHHHREAFHQEAYHQEACHRHQAPSGAGPP